MSSPVRVVQFGLGPIGLETVRTLARKQESGLLELVGAIDNHPEKAGKNLFELAGLPNMAGRSITIEPDAAQCLSETKPDVVLHTTSSFMEGIGEQLELCAVAGAHVISSTEELFFPHAKSPELARRIDEVARQHGVVITGTGVNPGFVMDVLALTATGVCTEVRSVRIERTVEAGKRRLPLQRKVGAGITTEEFSERAETGTFGHIGLIESLLFLAANLGWNLDRHEEVLQPVLARETVTTPYLTVQPGQVAGIHHSATGFQNGNPVISLDLKMFVGAGISRDHVIIDGVPPISLVLEGGVFGDTATVAMLVNAIPLVMKAPPGLRTAAELFPPRAFATRKAISLGDHAR